jgi:hypothetical protein
MTKTKTREEYNAYMREYMNRRYYQRKEEAHAFLGGKCVMCGTVEDLHVDHFDVRTKEEAFAKFWNWPKDRFYAELRKCQLLCAVHHKEKTKHEGSHLKGENNPASKLTVAQVLEIRRRYRKGSQTDGVRALAREFGVCRQTVTFVIEYRTWTRHAVGDR